jgi:2-polyprenyl-3-methyl-5-hydroxy-6-metoxy-1,4-benzoquinol methylase
MTNSKTHWEEVYSENAPNEVSWFRTEHETSLRMMELARVQKDSWIIDVGAGASTLVDQLLARGYEKISLLDVSSKALQHARARLGGLARQIEWIESDIQSFQPKHPFAIWHDRAVFHFLTEPQERRSYVRALRSSLLPGGHAIISTFAIGGPQQCSGLDVVQYDAEKLSHELGSSFELICADQEIHHTPWNTEQKFLNCLFRMR